MNRFLTRVAPAFLILSVLVAAPAACAEPSAAEDEERILRDAGLDSAGPALLAFFHARACMDVDGEQLRQLVTQFAGDGEAQRAAAKSALLGFGALALPALRQAANDLSQPQAAARAADCLAWLEGPSSRKLLTAAVHELALRKPQGAAAALLAYLPFADNADVVAAVTSALSAVAAAAGKPDAALLQGLSDRQSVRRAAAAVALCRAVPPHQLHEVRKLLKDPAAKVRLRAAKALAEAKDAEAIPVLIDLLAELSAEERQPVEDLLKQLAGEWAPDLQFPTEDDISRGIRRDAWLSWWRRTDGPALLAALAKHTLTPDKRRQLQELVTQLGSEDFAVREGACGQLLALGRLALPRLREVVKAGKLLKELAFGYNQMSKSAGNIDMRSNDCLLIARTGDGNQVSELDGGGKMMREWKANDPLTVSPVPNGHLLIATGSMEGLYELNRAGKIVWQYRGQGQGSRIFRARRR